VDCLVGIPDPGQHVRDRIGHHDILSPLPARLTDTGDFAAKRHLPETDAADPELPEEGTGSAAPLAAVAVTHAELLLAVIPFY
jgi:hypothetical protein